MILNGFHDLNKIPKEVLEKIEFIDKDKIGFNARISTKTGKVIGPFRFDFPFDSEALVLYIDEDPKQLIVEAKFVYILYATGVSIVGSRGEMRSSTCFTTKEKAESFIPKFKVAITDHKRLTCLSDDDNLKIEVLPLEIVE